MQLHHPDRQAELAAQGAQLLVVSFAPSQELRQWLPFFRQHYLEKWFAERGREVPDDIFARTRFLSDASLAAYHAYGLGRHSPWRAYGPKIIWQYLFFIAAGKPLRRPRADTLQKGGDFVVNRDGLLTLAHIGIDQSDRAGPDDILAALNK